MQIQSTLLIAIMASVASANMFYGFCETSKGRDNASTQSACGAAKAAGCTDCAFNSAPSPSCDSIKIQLPDEAKWNAMCKTAGAAGGRGE